MHTQDHLAHLIVCLTGMPGAGKSTIAGALKGRGFDVIVMGDAVRAEAARRNIEPTGANLGKLMLDLRRLNGEGAIAELIESQIKDSKSHVIVIDGVRSNAEVDRLRDHGRLRILAVHAAAPKRLDFLSARGRSDDPKTRDGLDERDDREMRVGMSDSIALADETISNNDTNIDELIEIAYSKILRWMRE